MNWPSTQSRGIRAQMNANTVGDFPPSGMTLPSGWEVSCDEDGNVFYIDHNTKTTQWEPPDNSPEPLTPQLAATEDYSIQSNNSKFKLDCPGRTMSTEPSASSSHHRYNSSLEDQATDSYEMEKLRLSQARMIWKYLLAVQSDFKSKSEITETLKSRLDLANVQSESLKQVMKSASGVASSNSLQCRNKNYDISALTKQYLESQKRVQQLRKDLSARGFSYNFSSTNKFDNSIWHLLEETPTDSLTSPEVNLQSEKGQDDTPSSIRKQLKEVIGAMENVRIQLAPLQPEFDHGRLTIIQEKESLMQELLNWHRDLIYEKSKTEKASLDEVEDRIYRLREEITINKQRCNFVSNRRLSLLERQTKLETQYRDLLVKLQESGVEFNRFDPEHRRQAGNFKDPKELRASTYPVQSIRKNANNTQLPIGPTSQRSCDNDYRFLSDVSPLEERCKPMGADVMKNSKSMGFLMSSYQNENQSASNETNHNSALRERLETYVYLSNISQLPSYAKEPRSPKSSECHASDAEAEGESGGIYENIIVAPRVPKRHSNEEHDRMTMTLESNNEAYYHSNPEWKRIPEVTSSYHRSEDSGIAFYENISGAGKNSGRSAAASHVVDEHSETLFACQVLIDIKFTVSNQLHVRLEEMKEVEMPSCLENIQFSVEILSMNYPHPLTGASCHCSRQFSAKELDIGGNLIVNEFMVFDLPRKELTFKILRIIIFCGSTSASSSFENFLVERHLNLFQVYTNQMREAASTSFWYHFTAVDTVEYDLRRSQPNDPTYHSPLDGDVYQNCNQMVSPKATAIPAKNFSFKCNRDVLQPPFYDNVSTPDTYKNCMAHVTSSQAMYTVKSAAIARLQVLNEATYLNPSELKRMGVEGCQEQQLVNSDEGYDERAVDCEGLTDSSSEYQNTTEVGLKRSHTVGQMRPYSSFNHYVYKKSSYASTKLNRSESDGATQQYLVKPSVPVSGIFGRCGAAMGMPSLPSPSPSLSNRFKRNAVERIPSRAKSKDAVSSSQRGNPSPNLDSSSPPPPMSGTSSGGSSLSPSPSIVTNLATNLRKKWTPGTTGSN